MSDTSQEGYVSLGKQTAQGTPATTVTTGILATSISVNAETENLMADPEIGAGRDRDAGGTGLASYKVAGSIEGLLRWDYLGHLLGAAGFQQQGAPAQEATTGAWEHTFVPGAPTYLTLETAWGRNRLIRRVSDVLIGNLELTVAGDEFCTFTAEFLGLREGVQASPSVPTFVREPAGTALGSGVVLDGLGTYRLSDMSMTIENNLSDDEVVIGQRELADITPGRREVGFSGTIKPQGAAAIVTDLYRAAVYGSKTATAPVTTGDVFHTSAELTFGAPRLIGTSTTRRYGLMATLPDVVLEGIALDASGDDPIEAAITGHALAGASPVATLKLRNGRATAY